MWEEIILPALIAIGAPILRSVAGWAQKALADKKVTKFELRQLYTTFVRISIISVATYYGLNGLGFDVDLLASGGSAILIDMILGSIKESKNVK